MPLLLGSGSGGSSSRNSSTSRLNTSNNSTLGVEDLEVVVVEISNFDNLTETEGGDVNIEDVGQVGDETLNVEFTHLNLKFTTSLNAFGVTNNAEGYTDCYRLLGEDLKEVDVEDVVGNGMELNVLEDNLHGLAIDGQVDDVDIGGVYKTTEIYLRN